jgi:hypothetical protein
MFEKLIRKIFGKSREVGEFLGRAVTHDAVMTFRMGAGFAGDVNRTNPSFVEPVLIDAAAPPTAYGQGVLIDPTTQGVRPLVAGDQALTSIYGITVRPFPQQAATAPQQFGGTGALGTTVAPPTSGAMDVLRSGYIMVSVVGATVKNGTVYIWTAASSGSHIQGGFEGVNPGGSGMALSSGAGSTTAYNGSPDANGIVELMFNI